ncbi:MAG TPA: putative glycolipid-binding domain-containing protein [Pyrinomonadaceae bacterium]
MPAIALRRTICWLPTWNKGREGVGLEHLLLDEHVADSVVLAFDEGRGPFRLTYRLTWDELWRLREADLVVTKERFTTSLNLRTDGRGRWRDDDGRAIDELDGCVDIDIWPTPFTNSFPVRREPMVVGERRQFRMAWVFAPDLTVRPQPQAYTRLADRLYLFESLDGSGFSVELPVDEDGIVLDYPGMFRRLVDSE